MTKHDDDAAVKANQRLVAEGKRIETEPLPGVQVGINLPVPEPAARLHKVPGRVTRAELAVIIRAVTLYLADNVYLDDDTMEKTGTALTEICKTYLRTEWSHRHADKDAP